ncbi:MAG: hypothetical protein ACD_45C00175G0005 [uncultured bacterium]|nr:MAG: hypothetical protein ACD_45C00175G0005 [uncultured bacterium]
MVIPIIITDKSTWPTEVSDFLEANFRGFEGWECSCCSSLNAYRYDSLVTQFREILRIHSLIGYHCTKLTKEEIESILANGMASQSAASLNMRIDRLLHSGSISPVIAKCLKDENQANDSNRKSMLWFCFFEPFMAGESGIGRFFKSWGGEALYNSHEENPVTGAALRRIGIPCIIKANVAIASMEDSKFPDGALARVLLLSFGHELKIPIKHEGYSIKNISADKIIEIIEYPSEKFIELTRCTTWNKYAI